MPIAEAGAIAVKTEGEVPEYLVITARDNPDHWLFPKGHIDGAEDPEDAAIRELREEAGVEGEFVGRIGAASYQHRGEEIEVTFFLIRAVAQGENAEGRTCRWLPYREARALLSFENVRAVLDAAANSLSAH